MTLYSQIHDPKCSGTLVVNSWGTSKSCDSGFETKNFIGTESKWRGFNTNPNTKYQTTFELILGFFVAHTLREWRRHLYN